MEYLIFGLIGIIVIVLAILYRISKNKKKRLEEIRNGWGKPKNESFDFNNISKYANLVGDKNYHRLSDQTLDDIDFYSVFEFIDRTTSKVGQQFLFKKLLEPTNNLTNQLERFVDLFSVNKELRETIQVELLKLNNNRAYFITSLLKDKLLEKPKWFNLLILNSIILIVLLVLSFKFSALLLALIVPVTINMLVHYWNKSNTFQFLSSFPQLNILINVSRVVLKKNESFYDKASEDGIKDLKTFQQKVSLINLDNQSGIQSDLSQLGSYLSELIKAILLIEVFALYRITRELENKKTSIRTLFNFIGSIDSAISIVSLRAGSEKTCIPVFIPSSKEMYVKNIYHPLIQDCVKNDLSVKGRSILITGSNMSGKSTFLRTLIINSILAQTIYTCFADEFVTPTLRQFSSIRIDDNLLDGKSYYFQEVNSMAVLLKQIDSSHQNLFVLDEVFKGTNTIERISSAKAILSYLNQKDNIVIVSTHDIELAEMLVHEYELFHFTETIDNNELVFDHKIKPGQLTTRNAIKILELANYPSAIIQEAQQISATLLASRLLSDQ